ncbi:MAG: sigma factor-like helix-turn-helix DNA-binding protein [Bacilli bacterium]|jgi:hypothetical protein
MQSFQMSDEQLVLLIQQGDYCAYYSLKERMEKYAKNLARMVFVQTRRDAYDESDFAFVFEHAFSNALENYLVGSVIFKCYFKVVFINDYRRVVFARSERLSSIISLDAPLKGCDDVCLHDVTFDSNSSSYQDMMSVNEITECLSNEENKLPSPQEKMVVALRLMGYSYRDIAKETSLSVKRVRTILGKILPKVKKLLNK